MRPRTIIRTLASTLLAGTALTVVAQPVSAATDFVLPAGLACSFELQVVGSGGNQIPLEFEDRDGNPVRTIVAGTGESLTFTNTASGESLTLRSNGAVQQTVYNADGTQTVRSTGHNVLILFPSDVPPGPSTTLVVGSVVYTVDSAGVFTLLSTSGQTTDICAELS